MFMAIFRLGRDPTDLMAVVRFNVFFKVQVVAVSTDVLELSNFLKNVMASWPSICLFSAEGPPKSSIWDFVTIFDNFPGALRNP